MIKRNFMKLYNRLFEDEVFLIDLDTGKILLGNEDPTFFEGYIAGIRSCGYEVDVVEKVGEHKDFVVQS